MKNPAPIRKHIKTAMRLPAALHADLQRAADVADISMNTEIINRLMASTGGASLEALMQQNREIMREQQKTQQMIQQIIDAISPRR